MGDWGESEYYQNNDYEDDGVIPDSGMNREETEWEHFLNRSGREIILTTITLKDGEALVERLKKIDSYQFNYFKSLLRICRERLENMEYCRENFYDSEENFENYDVYTSDEEASEEEELEDEEFKDPRKFSNLEKVNLQISVYQNSMDFSKCKDRFRNNGDRTEIHRSYKTNPALKNRSGWQWLKFEVRKTKNQYIDGPDEWMEGPKSLNIVSIIPIVHDSYTKHRSPLLHGFLYMYNNRSSKYNLNIPFFHSQHIIRMLECELYDGFVDFKEGIDKDECSSSQNSLNIDFCVQKRIIDKSLPIVFMKEIERVGDKLAKLMRQMREIIATAERPAEAPVKTEAEIAREEAERIMRKNREDAEEAAARRVAEQTLVKMEADANIRAEQTGEQGRAQDKRRRDPRCAAAFITTYEDEIDSSHLPRHLPPELTQQYSTGSSTAGRSEYSAATNIPSDWTPQLAAQYQWDASARPARPVWASDQEQKQHDRTDHKSADVKTENDGSEAKENPRKRRLEDSADPLRKMTPSERVQFYKDLLAQKSGRK